MKTIIETKNLQGEQVELVVGKESQSGLLGRYNEQGEIIYDIAVVNPAVVDLIQVLNTSEGTPVFKGNPLMQGEAHFAVNMGKKSVPIGSVEFVPEAAIGAAVIKFERIDNTEELSGYFLSNFEILGTINLIDTRAE